MERTEWLKQMREKVEAMYDLLSPEYWSAFGLYASKTHLEYLQKFLDRLAPQSSLLSAACGAGRYDGLLLEEGHRVVGIDQSEGMLGRAREYYPEIRYEKTGLQEMDFQEEFDGIICIDALEHVCPEDWPGILHGFQAALKPGGVLYFTAEVPEPGEVEAAFQRARKLGLPVVYGESVDRVDEAFAQMQAFGLPGLSPELLDASVYHYYPSLEQVRT